MSNLGGSGIQSGNNPVTTAIAQGLIPSIVASGVVTGATANVAPFTIYTPSAQGVYEICGGWVVTSAGSTGATLAATPLWYNDGVQQHVVGGLGGAGAATVIGDTNSSAAGACNSVLADTAEPIQIEYSIGGSPGTNPTYTYWYVVTKK